MVAYWADTWTDEELAMLQVTRGDPAGHARLEAFTLLHSIHTWRSILCVATGSLSVMGDALGVLHDAQNIRAADPILNLIMAELALVIAPMGHELRAIHLWTQRNTTCDALSRLTASKELPESLKSVRRVKRRSLHYKVMCQGEKARTPQRERACFDLNDSDLLLKQIDQRAARKP